MVDRLGVHRFNETEIVCNLRGMWEQLADPGTTLAVLCKLKLRGRDGKVGLAARHACQTLSLANGIWQVGTSEVG